ncbi:MAG: hypothetical protein ACK5MZ_01380 [Aestuariibaculum sp.]
MTIKNTQHETLNDYFVANSNLYHTKKSTGKMVKGLLIAVPFIILAIKPELINLTGIGFRIIFGVIGLIVLALHLLGGVNYYNIKSGGKIKHIRLKKFQLSNDNTMDEIVEAYENDDFQALRDAASTDNGSLHLNIWHDKTGKEVYLLLVNNYYGTVNYKSSIKIFSNTEYDTFFPILKKI